MFLLRGFKRSIQSPPHPLVKQKLKTPESGGNPAWELAWRAIIDFEAAPAKVEGLPSGWNREAPATRRRAQRFYYGYLRWREALRPELAGWLRRWPKPALGAALQLGAFELLDSAPERRPAIVHATVGEVKRRLSAPESKLANAVLRRFAEKLEEGWQPTAESAHPAWLVERWRAQWGDETTAALTRWNQSEPTIYARWENTDAPPASWRASPFPGYWEVDGPEAWEAAWPLLEAHKAYIQDPFARHPVELLDPKEGETLLDACAAPGGKTRALARAARLAHLVAIDLPGPRLERLTTNLSGMKARILGHDLTTLRASDLRAAGLPVDFDGILLDVPCSNTGVIARRPDVRHHLLPAQLETLPRLQHQLLENVARLVRPGGRLVYSTCSLEREENEAVVEAFLATHADFRLSATRLSRPWMDRHDGGGAFLLTRSGGEK